MLEDLNRLRSTPVDLPTLLRDETAVIHKRVETVTGIPGLITTTLQYALVLQRLNEFHRHVEIQLADESWADDWAMVGVSLADHSRSQAITDDLRGLAEAPAPTMILPSLTLPTFAHALGCLYVVEGSALGARVIAPLIRESLGDVPLSYYEGAGRHSAHPWRAVLSALRRFSSADADAPDVLEGARDTFLSFGLHLAAQLWADEPADAGVVLSSTGQRSVRV